MAAVSDSITVPQLPDLIEHSFRMTCFLDQKAKLKHSIDTLRENMYSLLISRGHNDKPPMTYNDLRVAKSITDKWKGLIIKYSSLKIQIQTEQETVETSGDVVENNKLKNLINLLEAEYLTTYGELVYVDESYRYAQGKYYDNSKKMLKCFCKWVPNLGNCGLCLCLCN